MNKINKESADQGYESETTDSSVYRFGTTDDCESLATLVNSAYHSELADQSWAVKSRLIPIERTNVSELFQLIGNDKYVFLLFFGAIDNILKGCSNVSFDPETKIAEIGMVAVRSDYQQRGYGKLILSVAENYASNHWNSEFMELNTVAQRPELFAFYIRRGYIDTGFRHGFPRSMQIEYPMLSDREFCTLRKLIKKNGHEQNAVEVIYNA